MKFFKKRIQMEQYFNQVTTAWTLLPRQMTAYPEAFCKILSWP